MTEDQKRARRRWHGDLNLIPVEIAYEFELRYVIENNADDGFRGSPARVAAAKRELTDRIIARLRREALSGPLGARERAQIAGVQEP
jgi:hypothetical protein